MRVAFLALLRARRGWEETPTEPTPPFQNRSDLAGTDVDNIPAPLLASYQ